LQYSEAFSPIASARIGASLLPPPGDSIEEETRCNVFWLIYSLDRLCSVGNYWPHSVDDQDCLQLLPVNSVNFSLGISWPLKKDRQHPLTKDVMFSHHIDQCDSFTLYVKGTMLLSRVKNFIIRYRSKSYSQEHIHINTQANTGLWEGVHRDPSGAHVKSPTNTIAFVELHQTAMQFRSSFPGHLRDPFASGAIDSSLYVACLIPYIALITLHDPFATIEDSSCMSAVNLMTSSRSILELLYAAQQTSYDLSLLDYICFYAWHLAGKTISRFWQVAHTSGEHHRALALRSEVEHIASVLRNIGERVLFAKGYSILLSEMLSNKIDRV